MDESECGVTNISACVAGAIDGFFRRLVDSALNPILGLLSTKMLTTPEPSELPRVGELWDSSWQLMLAMYGLVVMAAGVLLMLHETLQTRWGWRELGPRLVVGFLAGAMSMILATKAIQFANGLAKGLAGDGVESDSAAAAFRSMMEVGDGAATSLFATMLLLALVVVLTILLITWVIRLVITVVLVAAAPLAMMCYALPGLDAIARWWWRAFGACLAIQVVQSLVLITGLRVFLSPNWNFFGPTSNGMISIIVANAMGLLLVKIPFWLLAALKISDGRGLMSSIVRGYVAYKAFGLLKSADKAVFSRSGGNRKPQVSGAGEADPYAKVRATHSGQLMLPLPGVRRVARPAAPPERIPSAASIPVAAPQGEQLMLPLPQFHGGVDLGPKPRLGRDGQYQLPIAVERMPRPAPSPRPPVPKPLPGKRGARPKQLALDYTPAPEPDPYAGLRPTRSGQYPLPIEVHRTPAPRTSTTPPPSRTAASSPTPPASRSTGRQLHLPLPDLPVRRRTRRTPRSPK
ncbi:hypothetical protein IU474_16755 [Nocardia otitidiscaviarum]|uniref:hypothetical protein n=1 Tax=Nocardia otitidiscaviarum TaxID=1823 RepID=UPI001895BE86|nr:hypothetical protein [Nocardia otitidiscaviarum]MBF6238701.1 hypothetical protein [Nocardia otitidiscaviarum]